MESAIMRKRFLTRSASAFLLGFILLLSQSAIVRSAPDFNELRQTASPARPFPPTQYVPSHDYDVKHIALDLRFDWQQEQALVSETLTFSPLISDLRSITLDAASLRFSDIKLGKTSLKYVFDEKKQHLTIDLDRAYQPSDDVKVVITYQTIKPPLGTRSVNGGGGLNFIKPTPDDPR